MKRWSRIAQIALTKMTGLAVNQAPFLECYPERALLGIELGMHRNAQSHMQVQQLLHQHVALCARSVSLSEQVP